MSTGTLDHHAEIERRPTGATTALLSVIVLTYNEEANLPACLDSLALLGARVFVVDSGSVDRTKELAIASGADVFEHQFHTHSAQWAWALDNLPICTPWVLALDADQRVTPELIHELEALASSENDVAGAFVPRRQIFRGRWIRHGGYYPKYLLKLFRRDRVRVDVADLVDHHFHVDGPTVMLRGDLVEANVKEDDISFWIEKHNRYATLLAQEELGWRLGARKSFVASSFTGNPDERTWALKRRWRSMPLYVRPFLYFVYRYVFRLGFLDGKQGAIFHFMQAFWFRLLVDIKLDEMLQQKARS